LSSQESLNLYKPAKRPFLCAFQQSSKSRSLSYELPKLFSCSLPMFAALSPATLSIGPGISQLNADFT
jgi:hypothetical protein